MQSLYDEYIFTINSYKPENSDLMCLTYFKVIHFVPLFAQFTSSYSFFFVAFELFSSANQILNVKVILYLQIKLSPPDVKFHHHLSKHVLIQPVMLACSTSYTIKTHLCSMCLLFGMITSLWLSFCAVWKIYQISAHHFIKEQHSLQPFILLDNQQ